MPKHSGGKASPGKGKDKSTTSGVKGVSKPVTCKKQSAKLFSKAALKALRLKHESLSTQLRKNDELAE